MSIESLNNRNDYLGNGSVLEYDYTFKIQNEQHLRVTKRDDLGVETLLVLNEDYTVSGVGSATGGTVIFPEGMELPFDYRLTIRRVEPLTQEVDIRNRGDFYPEVHEDAFDHFIAVAQQQQDELDRSLKLAETVSPLDFDNALPAGLAGAINSVLMTNDDGDGWKMGPNASDISAAQPNAAAAAASAASALSHETAAASYAASANTYMLAAQATVGSPADGSVTTAKIVDLAVTTAKINDLSVTTAKINDSAVTTAKINDSAVTLAKIAAAVQEYLIPAGSVMAFAGMTIPSGWLLADGSEISRSTYANLFSAIGTTAGWGNGTTTFHLPNYCGKFLRGSFANTTAYSGTGAAISSNTLVTTAAHGYKVCEKVQFGLVTGVSGVSVSTTYYVIPVTTTSFKVATSMVNAQNGTAISISGTSTFSVQQWVMPDWAARLAGPGASTAVISSTEEDAFRAHSHTLSVTNPASNASYFTNGGGGGGTGSQTSSSSGGNETRPINITVNYIIKV